MTNRSGFALLAALWLVVAIAAVALGLGLEARERRAGAIAVAERTAAHAAATGGFAVARSRLEEALRRRQSIGSAADALRASDPWLDADSLFRDPLIVGEMVVQLQAVDLGTKLNINTADEIALRSFLAFVLRDYDAAVSLAQAIEDWRDGDDLRRPRGAERDDYAARDRLDLPSNRPFRAVDDIRHVEGMTPDLFFEIAPYVTANAKNPRVRINVNAAPEAVLRAGGIGDPIVDRILAARSQGRRIHSLAELVPAQIPGGNGGRNRWEQQMSERFTLVTTDLELVATAFARAPARPFQTQLTVQRQGNSLRVRR